MTGSLHITVSIPIRGLPEHSGSTIFLTDVKRGEVVAKKHFHNAASASSGGTFVYEFMVDDVIPSVEREFLISFATTDYAHGGSVKIVPEYFANLSSSASVEGTPSTVDSEIIEVSKGSEVGGHYCSITVVNLADEGNVVNVNEMDVLKREYTDNLPDIVPNHTNIPETDIDLNTLDQVVVPSWATRAIVKGLAAANSSLVTVEAGGVLVVEASSGDPSDSTKDHSENTVPLNDDQTLKVRVVNNGSANAYSHLKLVGFEGEAPTEFTSMNPVGSASFEDNGWVEMPNGYIMMWGTLTPNSRLTTVTLPKEAPNKVLNVTASLGVDFTDSPYEDNSLAWGGYPNGTSRNSIIIMSNLIVGGSTPTYRRMYWQAICY